MRNVGNTARIAHDIVACATQEIAIVHAVFRIHDRLVTACTAACGAVLFLSLSAGIISRVFTGRSLQWSEETARYAMIYGVAFGAALAYRAGLHVGLSFVADFVAGRYSGAARRLAHGLTVLAGLILAWSGATLAAWRGSMETPSLGIPVGYVYWAMALLGVLLALEAARAVVAPSEEQAVEPMP